MPTKISKNIHKEIGKCYGVDGPPYMRETFIPSFAKILVTAMTLKFASVERETTRLRAYNNSFPIIELKSKPTLINEGQLIRHTQKNRIQSMGV